MDPQTPVGEESAGTAIASSDQSNIPSPVPSSPDGPDGSYALGSGAYETLSLPLSLKRVKEIDTHEVYTTAEHEENIKVILNLAKAYVHTDRAILLRAWRADREALDNLRQEKRRNAEYDSWDARATRRRGRNNSGHDGPRRDGPEADLPGGESAPSSPDEGAGAETIRADSADDDAEGLQDADMEDLMDVDQDNSLPGGDTERTNRRSSRGKKRKERSGSSDILTPVSFYKRRHEKPRSKPDGVELTKMLVRIFDLAVEERELGLDSIRLETYKHVTEGSRWNDKISKDVQKQGLSARDLIKNEHNRRTVQRSSQESDPESDPESECHVVPCEKVVLDKQPAVQVGGLVRCLRGHPLDTGVHSSADMAKWILDGTVMQQEPGYNLQQRCVDLVKYAPHFLSQTVATGAVLALCVEYDDLVGGLDVFKKHGPQLTMIDTWREQKQAEFFGKAGYDLTESNMKIWQELGDRLRKRER
ncbi:hypothetical protein BU16DRAFT_567356 [Lophium mytilinum]|uniref:Uncharacterized protein n=1 Tax=Lophium mytilinum TaxID=390894 RepID=A0A6A6QB06_9PEZI|nr:hypothetical protein BU16DRAFT_567356 [Lophium mytilinum]